MQVPDLANSVRSGVKPIRELASEVIYLRRFRYVDPPRQVFEQSMQLFPQRQPFLHPPLELESLAGLLEVSLELVGIGLPFSSTGTSYDHVVDVCRGGSPRHPTRSAATTIALTMLTSTRDARVEVG